MATTWTRHGKGVCERSSAWGPVGGSRLRALILVSVSEFEYRSLPVAPERLERASLPASLLASLCVAGIDRRRDRVSIGRLGRWIPRRQYSGPGLERARDHELLLSEARHDLNPGAKRRADDDWHVILAAVRAYAGDHRCAADGAHGGGGQVEYVVGLHVHVYRRGHPGAHRGRQTVGVDAQGEPGTIAIADGGGADVRDRAPDALAGHAGEVDHHR